MLEQFTASSAHPYYAPVFIFIELALGFHQKIAVMTTEKQGYPCPGSSRQKRNCRVWWTLFRRPQFFTSMLWSSVPLSRVPCVTASHPFSGGKQLPAQNMASPYFKPSKHIQRRSFVQNADKTVYITYIPLHLEESIKKNIHMLKSKNRKLIFNLALILFLGK